MALSIIVFGLLLSISTCSATPRLHRHLESVFDDMRPSNDVIPSHTWRAVKRFGIQWVKRTMYEDANSVEDLEYWPDDYMNDDLDMDVEKRYLNEKCTGMYLVERMILMASKLYLYLSSFLILLTVHQAIIS